MRSSSDRYAKARRCALLVGIGAFYLSSAHAQIATDGSLGARTSLSGPNYYIDPAYGQQRGGNLFHSLSTFNVLTGQRAFFDSNSNTVNIIARVTGGSASLVNGTIAANANLFLLNPQGVVFGANASLNVAGSFHATTADYIRFSDDSRFYVASTASSSLTTAPPSAFGFLDNSVAPIVLQGSYLRVPTGKSLSLVGGHVTLTSAQLSASGGQLTIAAVASAGEVEIGSSSAQLSGFTTLADINFTQSSVNTDDEEGANVFIRGGRFVMGNNSEIGGVTTQAGSARTIDIDARSVQLDSSQIVSASLNSGAATNVQVRADQVSISNGSSILSTTANAVAGGDITIRSTDLQLTGGLSLVGTAAVAGSGRAGNVSIASGTVSVTGGAITAVTASAGNAGNIDINATAINLSQGGGIASSTASTGNGGVIRIRSGSLNIDGTSGTLATGITVASTNGTGGAGNITLSVDSLSLNKGFVTSSTSGFGVGGDIDITSRALSLNQASTITSETGIASNANQTTGTSRGGAININTETMQVRSGSRVSASTFGDGAGGTISVIANQLNVDDQSTGSVTGILANSGSELNNTAKGAGGNVSLRVGQLAMINRGVVNANTYGTGVAGRIDIVSNDVALSNSSIIGASSFGQMSNAGRANDISIQSSALHVTDRAQISNSTYGSGAAGRLLISTQALEVTDGGTLQASSLGTVARPGAAGDIYLQSERINVDAGNVLARSFGVATPGGITMNANVVNLTNGAIISATSSGGGNAGNVTINASDTFSITNGSRLVTEALNGSGGNIAIISNKRFIARESIISTSVLGIAANGGNILIDPIYTIIDNSQIIARAVGGSGGRIDISTRYLLSSANSNVDASSALGINGKVEIVGIDVDLNADIAPLPMDFLNAKKWLATPCAARQGSDVSQFTVNGRDGAYLSPSDFAISPMQWGDIGVPNTAATATEITPSLLPQMSFTPLCLQSGA